MLLVVQASKLSKVIERIGSRDALLLND